ncbi:MAG: hydrolase 1, exosortase A system-associated [Gammaproteobacteria bacterium]|nr:hydrolase 1, exosortase A system-associated [Gammaproteobacteria bacterium]
MNRVATRFECAGDTLVGIVDYPAVADAVAMIVITGGPQYRIGSHRQFVELARQVAAAGHTVMRFDQRGAGDSDGQTRSFDQLDDDVRAAVDELASANDSIDNIVLWGLCDGASAALLYAPTDNRIGGLVLLNPWVRRESTEAQARVSNYYPAKLADMDFWKRLLSGRINIWRSGRSFVSNLLRSRRAQSQESRDFVDRMRAAATASELPVLVILSGQDLTAQEFIQVCEQPQWRDWIHSERVTVEHLPDANHTFSRPADKQAVARLTTDWLGQLRRR